MSSAIKAGELRHRLTIQAESRASDGQGGATVSWTTHATVWGKLEPVAGREDFQALQVQGRITHQARIRYLSTITPAMRISFDGRTFNIRAVLDYENRKIWQQLLLEEGTGQ